MGQLKTTHTPELRGLYANSNRFTQPQGTVPRICNLYMTRRGAFHTVPGSLWVSSFDGSAPHVSNQQPINSIIWYAPSPNGSANLYMAQAGFTPVATNHYLLITQKDGSVAGIDLENASGATIQPIAIQGTSIAPTLPNSTQFGDYLITAFGSAIPPNIFPTVTQLTAAITNTVATSIAVYDTSAFPSTGTFSVDSEVIAYASKTPGSFNSLTRGFAGTAAASHAANALVFRGGSSGSSLFTTLFFNANPTDTSITVKAPLPAGWPTSGYVLIDAEVIQYTGITLFPGFDDDLTGCTRGASSTTPAFHAAGTAVSFLAGSPPFTFTSNVWGRLLNNFDPSLVYGLWPGTVETSSATNVAAVNIGTIIYVLDGQGTAWLFRAQNSGVTAFGPKYAGPQFFPRGFIGIDGVMTAGSPNLSSVNGGFTAALVGQPITVSGAGASGNLMSTVATFTDKNHISLSDAATTAVSDANFVIGTGQYGDIAKDFNPAAKGTAGGQSGTVVWLNVGQANLPAPGAAFVFQHLNALFLWGVGATYGVDGISGPDALWQSDFGAPMTFNPANTTFVGKGNGQVAQGGAIYALSEAGIASTPQIVLFKDASSFVFLNSFPNATLTEVSGGLGCIAPNTIQFIGGYGVMRLSYAGVTLFDGQLEHVTEYTDPIRAYLFGGVAGITPVDFTKIQNCVSTQVVNPPMYIFFAPIQGNSGFVTRGFGYDFGLKQWFVMDFAFAISSAAFLPQSVAAIAQAFQSLVGGSTDGAVRRIFAGDPDWDGIPITWHVQLPDWGFPGSPVYIRRCNPFITPDGGGAAPALTSVTLTGVRRSGQPFTRPLNTPISILASLDVGEIALSAGITIRGQGQILLEGTDAQTSDLPTGRVGK